MIMTISYYLFTYHDGVLIYLFLYILLFQSACKETKFILGYLFLYVNSISYGLFHFFLIHLSSMSPSDVHDFSQSTRAISARFMW
jgi:hypothetical protein